MKLRKCDIQTAINALCTADKSFQNKKLSYEQAQIQVLIQTTWGLLASMKKRMK